MNNSTDHLSESVAAAYVDGRLTREERSRAQSHLADCVECRTELVAVSEIVHARSRKGMLLLPLAAAAAIVVLAINMTDSAPTEPVLRGTQAEEAIVAVYPGEAALVRTSPQFTWLKVSDAMEYRLTLTDRTGDVVTERVVADTATTVSSLNPGSYRWYVTAILSDGTLRTSRTRGFEVSP